MLVLRITNVCALQLLDLAGAACCWEGGGLLFPSPYHGLLAVKGCACLHACGLAAVFRPLTACVAPC